jgi:hypothetical protein
MMCGHPKQHWQAPVQVLVMTKGPGTPTQPTLLLTALVAPMPVRGLQLTLRGAQARKWQHKVSSTLSPAM